MRVRKEYGAKWIWSIEEVAGQGWLFVWKLTSLIEKSGKIEIIECVPVLGGMDSGFDCKSYYSSNELKSDVSRLEEDEKNGLWRSVKVTCELLGKSRTIKISAGETGAQVEMRCSYDDSEMFASRILMRAIETD